MPIRGQVVLVDSVRSPHHPCQKTFLKFSRGREGVLSPVGTAVLEALNSVNSEGSRLVGPSVTAVMEVNM